MTLGRGEAALAHSTRQRLIDFMWMAVDSETESETVLVLLDTGRLSTYSSTQLYTVGGGSLAETSQSSTSR